MSFRNFNEAFVLNKKASRVNSGIVYSIKNCGKVINFYEKAEFVQQFAVFVI